MLKLIVENTYAVPTITTMSELMDILESGKYNYYGLRGATNHDVENINRGYLDCSYNWIDGEKTDDPLDGTCALSIGDFLTENEIIKRYNRCAMYNASHGTNIVLLIADNSQTYGEDENEVILGSNGYGADVVAIVDI